MRSISELALLAIILLIISLLFPWVVPLEAGIRVFGAVYTQSGDIESTTPKPIHSWLNTDPLTGIEKYYSCISTRTIFGKEDILCAIEQSVYLVKLASEITRNSLDVYEKASRIQLWMARHIKYVEDEDLSGRKEYVLSPIETLYMRKGDCEDKALLAASLMLAAGLDSVAIVDIKLENTSIRHIEPAIIVDNEVYIIPPINGTYPMSLLDYASLVSEYISRPVEAKIYLLSHRGIEATWSIFFPKPARKQAVLDEFYVKSIESEARRQILKASGSRLCPSHVRSLLAEMIKLLPQKKTPIIYPLYMFYIDLLVYDSERKPWWPSLYGRLLAHQALAGNLYTWLTREGSLYCVEVSVETDYSLITSYKYGVEGELVPVVEEREVLILYVVAISHPLLEDSYYAIKSSEVVFGFIGSTNLLEEVESIIIYRVTSGVLEPLVGIVGNESLYFTDLGTVYASKWLVVDPGLLRVVVDRAKLEEELLSFKPGSTEYLLVAWSRRGYPLYAGFFRLGVGS